MTVMTGISVLVLTKNEQQDLPGCLASVAWSDDIQIFDSGSTDATHSIAQQCGAHVTVRDYGSSRLAFGGDEGAHRTWGLRNIAFKHPWVFVIDADERMTPELMNAMQQVVASPQGNVAFRVRRRDYFLNTWLKHVTPSPFNIRLFRPGSVHYERLTNPVTVVDGQIGDLAEHFNHFPFSKGMRHWIDKHNGYSTFEAGQITANLKAGGSFSIQKALFSKDANQRRFHQKELYYRLPLRPLVMFLLLYFGKRGFLDGRAGLTYAILRSIYEYFIVLKTRELESQPFKS
jgi:glycosyltransferase involved in cell wall biosynthesis